MYVFLNGDYVERSDARIPVDDRGFLFADAIYEALRARRGRIFEAERHMARMRQGFDALRFGSAALCDEMLGAAARLLELNSLGDAPDVLVYMHATRGAAPRKHAFPPADTMPTVFVSVSAFAAKTELCARGAAAITHPDLRWARCDLKTTNLLPNALANQAAQEAGAYEAILVRDDIVTEGTHCNVFGVVRGELRTHPLGHRILRGITRDVVIELAQARGLTVREEAMREDELRSAEEVFLTGTTTDVMPIVTLDGAAVGDGRPGPVASALRDDLEGRMRAAFESLPSAAGVEVR